MERLLPCAKGIATMLENFRRNTIPDRNTEREDADIMKKNIY
jgi:hypothetical protein